MAQTLLNLAQGVTGTLPTSNYVDNSGAFVKIEHKNITSAVSSVDFQQKFNATYENYYLHVSHLRPSTDHSNLYMQFLSGTDTAFSTSVYNYSATDYNNVDGNNSFFGLDTSFARITRGIDTDSATTGKCSFTMNFMTPFTTDHPPEYMWHGSYRSQLYRPMVVGSGTVTNSTAFTGVRFYQHTGNIAEFTGTLYGIVE